MVDDSSEDEEIISWELESFEFRCSRRLEEDLGVNSAGTEVILHMRDQIRQLQERVHQLEIELTARRDSRQRRLSSYRQVYFEATWGEFNQPDEAE